MHAYGDNENCINVAELNPVTQWASVFNQLWAKIKALLNMPEK